MVDPELEEQMKMLEGLDLGADLSTTPMATPLEVAAPQTVAAPVQQMTSQVTNMAAAPVQPAQPAFVPQQQVVNQPVQTVAPAPATAAPAAPAMDLNQAPVFVDLAANAYQTKTDFFSLKDGEKSRVTLANLNFIRTHTHYVDGLGRFKCMSTYDENNRWPVNRAVCCQFPNSKDPSKFENAKNRMLVPVIEYPVSKTDGKTIIQGAKPKLKMWDMNYVEEKQLIDILENYKTGDNWSSIDLNSLDLSLTKSKAGDYATITIVAMPSWRNNFAADINAEIAKINQEFYNDAYKECARVVSEDTVRNALNSKQQQEMAAQQFTNMVTPDASALGINMSLV